MNKLDISDQNKIANLVECFESLCNGEESHHIFGATIIFLVKMHRIFSKDNVSLEDQAENLKETFISLNKNFDTLNK